MLEVKSHWIWYEDKDRNVYLRPDNMIFLEPRESGYFKTWVPKSILTESEGKFLIFVKSYGHLLRCGKKYTAKTRGRRKNEKQMIFPGFR